MVASPHRSRTGRYCAALTQRSDAAVPVGLERRTLRQEHSLSVKQGQRLRLNVTNQTMMTHPLHVHGHTLALADTGLRKDTLLLRPMETRAIDLVAWRVDVVWATPTLHEAGLRDSSVARSGMC